MWLQGGVRVKYNHRILTKNAHKLEIRVTEELAVGSPPPPPPPPTFPEKLRRWIIIHIVIE
ncbi:hypothetical protein Csa_004277 [Cucumis sativus]|uniref:Uncharacterized protein n=1 Tax=Cucumis sativus TaxID=3659 RepID=A0A0A0KJD6_CUCSA|nr:hypothetical protein Csa_004277 [Cucumis sativus]